MTHPVEAQAFLGRTITGLQAFAKPFTELGLIGG